MQFHHFTGVLAFLGATVFARGAELGDSAGRDAQQKAGFHVERWTSADGLPQNKVQCVLQTRDGNIWAGTQQGLARFDGVRFTVIGAERMLNAPLPGVFRLAEDKVDGSLWISSNAGLFRLRGRELIHYTPTNGLPHHKVWRLLARTDGELWMETDKDMARFKDGKFTHVTAADGLLASRPTWMDESPGGDVWLGNGSWRQRFDVQRKQFTALPFAGLPNDLSIMSLRFAANGDLLIGTEHGLYRGQDGRWQHYDHASGLGDAFIHFIMEDSRGQVWVATKESGVYRFEDGRFVAVDLGLSEGEFTVDGMIEDLEGNLWFATREGLIRLQRRPIRTYTAANGLADDYVHCVQEGPDGTVWVGSSQGISWSKDGKFMHLRHKAPRTERSVRSILVDRTTNVWVSTYGVWKFQDERLKQVTSKFELSTLHVQSLYEDRAGGIWIGTGRGVVRWHDGRPQWFKTVDGRDWNGGDAFLEDRHGNIWIGNAAGLHRVQNGKITRFTQADGLAHDAVRALHEDGDGALWVGTLNGLSRFSAGRFFSFNKNHGMPELQVNQILEDEFGVLWMSGSKGIHRVSRSELVSVAEGGAASGMFVTFAEGDGMLTSQTMGGVQPAGCRTRHGQLWFATIKGVVEIDPKEVKVNTNRPPVFIEQFLADGQIVFGGSFHLSTPKTDIAGRSPPKLSAPEISGLQRTNSSAKLVLSASRARSVAIYFTANSFVAPEKIRFKYRLHGYDKDWREPDREERVARYTNLRPGDYRFQVIGCNNHGYWNETGDSLAFYLAPTFTQTAWFPALLVLAGIGASLGLTAWRLRWQRRALQAEHVAEVERQRARIARDLHDDLGASLTGIALELEAAHRRGKAKEEQLATLAGEARALALDVRELAWTTNPRCDNLGSLRTFLGELAERFCQAAEIECKLEIPAANDTSAVAARTRHELLIVAKESLANIVKHAAAKTVTLKLSAARGELCLTIHDDGCGFDLTLRKGGTGLQNLCERLEQAGGRFEIQSRKGSGTAIVARLALNEVRATE